MIEVNTILAGGPDDFTEVRRLVLSGTHQEMGHHLATLAAQRYDWRPAKAHDPGLVRKRRAWFEAHWPAHAARMRGAALACGVSYDDDTVELGEAPYLMSLGACSVAWHPPQYTVDGHGRLSRNYDFSTGTLAEFIADFLSDATSPPAPVARVPGTLPMTARPHVIESYPDSGYATLQLRSYDLLGGCLDGINSAGLTVALLADRDGVGIAASREPRVGINELELNLYLLETCASVEEALDRLSRIEHYVSTVHCHFVIADRTGTSVVWEPFTSDGASIVVGGKQPQIVTNHQLTRFPSAEDLPAEAGEGDTYQRWRVLTQRVSNSVLTPEQIAQAAGAVRFPANAAVKGRTLWNAQYDVQALTLDIDFYLGDDGHTLRYSPRLRLGLDRERVAARHEVA